MNLRIFLILILFCCLSRGENFDPVRVLNLSDKEVIEMVKDRLNVFSDREKLVLVEKIFQDERDSLFLDLMEVREFPTNQVFEKAPSSHFKFQLTLDILKSDRFWSIPLVAGASGVGSLYQQSLILCYSVIDPFFKNVKIDWDRPLTRDRRMEIAKNFEDLLVKEEGFTASKIEKNDPRDVGDRLSENSFSERPQQESTNRPNQKNETQKDVAVPNQSNLSWIIVGVLLLILALFFIVWKGKSER